MGKKRGWLLIKGNLGTCHLQLSLFSRLHYYYFNYNDKYMKGEEFLFLEAHMHFKRDLDLLGRLI
jgi:hypothetical protein